MTNEESTIEYFIPPTKEQSGLLFPLLRKVAEVHGVKDKKVAEDRMRNVLIDWGYIKKSRSELDRWHTSDVIDRYTRFLEKRGVRIKQKNHT